MNPEDAERLELLQLLAKNAGDNLENALRVAELATDEVIKCRAEHNRRVRARDEFKSALDGMKEGRYA